MMPPFERRLRAEWDLLRDLERINPGRFTALLADDVAFSGSLHGVAAVVISRGEHDTSVESQVATSHQFRVRFPVHFPAVPMELYLQTPVRHPNVHPETGFVCLWDRHRVSNTIEIAMHRLVAMLAGRLSNTEAQHVMQPGALALTPLLPMGSTELRGVQHSASASLPGPEHHRRRLS